MHRTPATVTLFFYLAVHAAAQTTWATLTGFVSDPTHAGIPGALVSIESVADRSVKIVKTSARGRYSFRFLMPGAYRLRTAARGFREELYEGIDLHPGERAKLPLTLHIGGVNSRIEVSAAMDQLQTESASRSSTIHMTELQEYPIFGRQIYNVLSLSPGVLYAEQEFGGSGYSGLRNWKVDGKDVINGGVEGANQFLLNNSPISLTGQWQVAPSVEAVQSVNILTNTYDAQYGRTGGGTVVTTVRTGGNQWHGTAYEFFNSNVLDANSFQGNLMGVGEQKRIAHQFGGTIEGPLRRDKDFLFVSLDNYREVGPSSQVSDTPPVLLRDGQHFSAYRTRIYNPYSAVPCTDGAACYAPYMRSPFPGNVIPESMISPQGVKILGLYPTPTRRSLTQNYFPGGSPDRYQYIQPIVRWDHNFQDRDRLYALAVGDHDKVLQSSNNFPGPANLDGAPSERTSQHYIVDWTRVLDPSSIGDLRISFGRFTQYEPETSCAGCLTASSLGISLPAGSGETPGAAPHIDLGLFSPVIGNTSKWNTENQFDVAPSFTSNRGRHVLHVGGEFVEAGIGQDDPGRANGEFFFNRSWTTQYVGRAQGVADGSSVADLLLGLPTVGYLDSNASFYRRWPYFAAYAQDNWRIRPTLTLSMGLRYDVQIPFRELNNQINTGFDPLAVSRQGAAVLASWQRAAGAWNAAHPGVPYPGSPTALAGGLQFASGSARAFRTDWTDLQPRMGVAWNFDPKTVLRAGAGIFYRTETQLGSSYGFNQRTVYTNSLTGGLTPSATGVSGPYSLADPYPNGVAAATGASLGSDTNLGNSITFYGRDRPIPRTYEYSVGLQRELPGLLLLEADYAGSVTVHDALSAELNPGVNSYPIADASAIAYQNTLVPNPFYGHLPATSQIGGTQLISIGALMRRYPQFGTITEANFPVARYRYDSLQLKLEKRVLDIAPAGILSFIFSYTFSKSFAADTLMNPFDLTSKPIHELAPYDRPQSVGFAGTWDMPFGWGRRYLSGTNRFVAALVNSWAMDWVYTFSSGTPVDEPDAQFTCGSFKAPEQTPQQWFNNDRNCWVNPPAWGYRTSPDRFGNIRTPGLSQLNLSVEKTIFLSDKNTLQLRGEAYNVANTPLFPGPSTNVLDPRFGQLPQRQINLPRYVQIALRFSF